MTSHIDDNGCDETTDAAQLLGQQDGQNLAHRFASEVGITPELATEISDLDGCDRSPVEVISFRERQGPQSVQAHLWSNQADVLRVLGAITTAQYQTLKGAAEQIAALNATVSNILDSRVDDCPHRTGETLYSAYSDAAFNAYYATVHHFAKLTLVSQQGVAYEVGHEHGCEDAETLTGKQCLGMVDHAGTIKQSVVFFSVPDPFAEAFDEDGDPLHEAGLRGMVAEVFSRDGVRSEETAVIQYKGGHRAGWIERVERKARQASK